MKSFYVNFEYVAIKINFSYRACDRLMIYSVYSLDRYFIYTLVDIHLYCFMYIHVYVCDIVCQHET